MVSSARSLAAGSGKSQPLKTVKDKAGTLVSLKPKPQGSGSTSCQQRALRFRLIISGGDRNDDSFPFILGRREILLGIGIDRYCSKST
jgi:hypothetical protein